MIELDDPSWWPTVVLDGVVWAVAPRMEIGMTIGEAAMRAEQEGCPLPTPELVAAVHRAADCKLPAEKLTWKHDGTPATMSTPAVIQHQRDRIDAMIAEWSAKHGPPRLVSGEAKEVVVTASGTLGIFGWYTSSGKPLQPLYTKHGTFWNDAATGL